MDDREGFQRLRTHFHALLELGITERQARLESLGRDDAGLRGALEKLLLHLDETDLVPEPEPLFIGQRLGPFELRALIGRGGMGEVFDATRVEAGFEQRVAVKLVRHGSLTAELARRFVRERQILARLSHPGIAHLIDGGVAADGRQWLAMEFVDGAPITVWCKRRNSSPEQRIQLLIGVCEALRYAHEHLIVHRDLKPANVLIDARGQVKLLDFGIAKLLDDDDSGTRSGARAGTPRYSAPEQIVGEPVTTAVDVYALGVLLFELLAAASPYPRAERGELSWSEAVLRETPSSLLDAALGSGRRIDSRGKRQLRGDLNRIAQRALARNARDRYASVAGLAEDLCDWLADRPLRSGAGGAAEQLRKLTKRYRWPLMLVASVVVALGAGLLLVLREAHEAQRQQRVAESHLNALMQVLASSAPLDFVGRERSAGELLQAAAQQLQNDYASDPRLQRRALGQIGHGLLNLGHTGTAEAVLRAALAAADRDPTAGAVEHLELLKLLVFSQAEPSERAAARQTAALIASTVDSMPQAQPIAIDALASAAGVLSRHLDFELARQMFVQIDQLPEALGAAPPAVRENTARQRGWVALRQADIATAGRWLRESRAVIGNHPQLFSALRRAETDLLLAEVAVLSNDATAAASYLAAAGPAILAEYPESHPERASFLLLQSRQQLAADDPSGALRSAQQAQAIIQLQPASPARDRLHAQLALADAAARGGECGVAQRALGVATGLREEPTLQPRDSMYTQAVVARVGGLCAQPSD